MFPVSDPYFYRQMPALRGISYGPPEFFSPMHPLRPMGSGLAKAPFLGGSSPDRVGPASATVRSFIVISQLFLCVSPGFPRFFKVL